MSCCLFLWGFLAIPFSQHQMLPCQIRYTTVELEEQFFSGKKRSLGLGTWPSISGLELPGRLHLSSADPLPSHSPAVRPRDASLEKSHAFCHDRFAICPVFLPRHSLFKSAAINIVMEDNKSQMEGAFTDQGEKSSSRIISY